MAQSGDEITYTFSGAKETEGISGIDEIVVYRIDGAGGGDNSIGTAGGSGGQIQNAAADVSNISDLDVFVGGAGDDLGGFGRSNGGKAVGKGGGGGGSTELVTPSGTMIIAADAGGGASSNDDGGGGGARGGSGGAGSSSDFDGSDAQGSGFGGDGADFGDNPGGDGGQELGTATLLATGSTAVGNGAAAETNGEIVVGFDKPLAPESLATTEDLSTIGPTVDLSWSNPGTDRQNNIFRTSGSSGSFPADFTEVGSVAAGTTTFRDSPPAFESTFTYRVTAAVNGGESDPSAPETITTSSEGELVVTITDTNSPVSTGDTLDLDVEVENIGDYRADEDIDAVLEPQ